LGGPFTFLTVGMQYLKAAFTTTGKLGRAPACL